MSWKYLSKAEPNVFSELRVKSLNSGCQKVKVGVIFVCVIARQERISLNLGRNSDLN